MVIGTDWSGEGHAYGDAAVVYACVAANGGGRVAVVADGTGIRVRPRSVAIRRSSDGVIPFHVTVVKGAAGGLRVQQGGGGLRGDTAGADVGVEGDGWHFVRHER